MKFCIYLLKKHNKQKTETKLIKFNNNKNNKINKTNNQNNNHNNKE